MLSKRNDTVVYIKRMGYGISDWMIDSKIPVILVFGEYFDRQIKMEIKPQQLL